MIRLRQHLISRGLATIASTLLLTSTAGITVAAAAEESVKADPDAIRIGLIAPLTGAAKLNGEHMVDGMNLFLDQIHHQIAGRKVQLIVENDDGSPATAVAKLSKLVTQDHVHVLAGLFLSNVAIGLAKFLDQYKTPFLDGPASADPLTQRKHPKYLVRVSFSASQSPHVMADWAYKKMGMRRVATIGADYAYGYEGCGGFQHSFQSLGGKVVQKLWAPIGIQDCRPLLKQLRRDVDGVFMVNIGEGAIHIPQQYKQMGFKMPIVAGPTSFDVTLSRIGDAAIGAVSCTHYSSTLDNQKNKAFVAAFREKYGLDPAMPAETAYVAGLCIQKAVEQLKGKVEDRDALLTALENVQLNTPRGPIKFDHWNPVENQYICKVVKVNGQLQNQVISTYPNVSQYWTWSPEEYLKLPMYTKDYPAVQ